MLEEMNELNEWKLKEETECRKKKKKKKNKKDRPEGINCKESDEWAGKKTIWIRESKYKCIVFDNIPLPGYLNS